MLGCMRTTVTIEDSLLTLAKQASLERHCSLGEVIDDALRATLIQRPKLSPEPTFRPLKTFRGSGVQPGVDLCSSSNLSDMMEGL